jgi:hypothetical protein
MIRSFLARFLALRGREGLNLLAPPLIAEIVIHVRQDGKRQMYVSKSEADPRQIVEAMLGCVMELANQHGIKISVGGK